MANALISVFAFNFNLHAGALLHSVRTSAARRAAKVRHTVVVANDSYFSIFYRFYMHSFSVCFFAFKCVVFVLFFFFCFWITMWIFVVFLLFVCM